MVLLPSISSCFNSRTPCGVRLYWLIFVNELSDVSIHAPRVGCDPNSPSPIYCGKDVSIHAPRVGCDLLAFGLPRRARRFNSRTPCGVRRIYLLEQPPGTSFNSRTPCGVRPKSIKMNKSSKEFQFTHPVWGATRSSANGIFEYLTFQFTHPVWGATSPHRLRHHI